MAEYLEKTDFQKSRAFSPAVITQGGKTVWLAGQTATKDEQGNDISGNFEAQVRTLFSLIDKTLKRCGGSLANLVTMTVFITDPRLGDKFVEMRRHLSGRKFSGERADHGLASRAAGHADRNSGRGRDRRVTPMHASAPIISRIKNRIATAHTGSRRQARSDRRRATRWCCRDRI